MKEYGLKWIWKQTRGTRGYLLLLSLAGIAMGVVNMGMTTVLMNLVNIAAGNLEQSIGRNVIWAISVGRMLFASRGTPSTNTNASPMFHNCPL